MDAVTSAKVSIIVCKEDSGELIAIFIKFRQQNSSTLIKMSLCSWSLN